MFSLISETHYRQTMETVVEPQLAALREELSMPLSDGGSLHAERMNSEPPRARSSSCTVIRSRAKNSVK